MGLQKGFGFATVFLWAEEGEQLTISEQTMNHRSSSHVILGVGTIFKPQMVSHEPDW